MIKYDLKHVCVHFGWRHRQDDVQMVVTCDASIKPTHTNHTQARNRPAGDNGGKWWEGGSRPKLAAPRICTSPNYAPLKESTQPQITNSQGATMGVQCQKEINHKLNASHKPITSSQSGTLSARCQSQTSHKLKGWHTGC